MVSFDGSKELSHPGDSPRWLTRSLDSILGDSCFKRLRLKTVFIFLGTWTWSCRPIKFRWFSDWVLCSAGPLFYVVGCRLSTCNREQTGQSIPESSRHQGSNGVAAIHPPATRRQPNTDQQHPKHIKDGTLTASLWVLLYACVNSLYGGNEHMIIERRIGRRI